MFLMWFFFKGGMLVKETKNFSEILSSSRKKLLKPFFYLVIISVILDSVLYFIDTINGGGYYQNNELIRTIGSLAINGSPHGNMPIWFLFSYFVVRVFFGCQSTFFKQISIWGILLACVLIPYLLHFCPFRYPYYFANIFIGLFGYYIGCIYKKHAEKYINVIVPISAFFVYRNICTLLLSRRYSH